ncbi:MAG: WG repeat-containing protein [Bacteroidia bacterium]
MDNPLNLYSAIFYSQEYKSAIFQDKNGKVFLAKENAPLQELPIAKIVDETKGKIRFNTNIDGVKKWGIIDISGFIVIPAIYDYISPLIADNYFRVFIGDYSWEYDEYSSDLFGEYLDTQSWNGDDYLGTLKGGKWGIVDLENRILVPVEYNWVELIDDRTVCCNVGGGPIIKWYDGDGKKEVISIADGLWKMFFLDPHHNKLETQLGTYDEVIEEFKKEYGKRMVSGEEYQYHSHNWQKVHRFIANGNT